MDATTVWRFVDFARNVWGIDGLDDFEIARAGIEKNKKFYESLGIPLTLSDAAIGSDRFDDILDRFLPGGNTRGNLKQLNREELRSILTKCL